MYLRVFFLFFLFLLLLLLIYEFLFLLDYIIYVSWEKFLDIKYSVF